MQKNSKKLKKFTDSYPDSEEDNDRNLFAQQPEDQYLLTKSDKLNSKKKQQPKTVDDSVSKVEIENNQEPTFLRLHTLENKQNTYQQDESTQPLTNEQLLGMLPEEPLSIETEKRLEKSKTDREVERTVQHPQTTKSFPAKLEEPSMIQTIKPQNTQQKIPTINIPAKVLQKSREKREVKFKAALLQEERTKTILEQEDKDWKALIAKASATPEDKSEEPQSLVPLIYARNKAAREIGIPQQKLAKAKQLAQKIKQEKIEAQENEARSQLFTEETVARQEKSKEQEQTWHTLNNDFQISKNQIEARNQLFKEAVAANSEKMYKLANDAKARIQKIQAERDEAINKLVIDETLTRDEIDKQQIADFITIEEEKKHKHYYKHLIYRKNIQLHIGGRV